MGKLRKKQAEQEIAPTSIVTGAEAKVEETTPTIETTKAVAATQKKGLRHKVKALSDKIKQVVKSKRFRIVAPIVLVLIIAIVAFVEPVRFAALSLFSKGSVELLVVDDTTLVPVEKATVTLGSESVQTGTDGKAMLTKAKYGNQTYKVEKENYTTYTGKVKVKPGNNVVDPVKFHSDGVPFTFTAINKLNRVVINDYKVRIGDSEVSALSDEKGTAILKVPFSKQGEVDIILSKEGFNDATVTVNSADTGAGPITAELTPSGRQYFLSNRTGRVGVFSSNLDGSDQVEVIPGTVSADYNAQLSISPNGKYAALVSERDSQEGSDGNSAPALFGIDLSQKTIKRIDEGAANFYIHGWTTDEKIVYTISKNEYQSDDNSKIKTADISTSKLETLHSQAGYLSFFYFAGFREYGYLVRSDQNVEEYGIFSINLQSKNKKRIHNSPSYDFNRTKSSTVHFKDNGNNKWYELDMTSQTTKESSKPSDGSKSVVISPNSQQAAWIEGRDGKGTLQVAYSDFTNQRQAVSGANVSTIERWVSEDYIIYTSLGNGESAQYIVHIPTGTVTKISDIYRSDGGYR